MRLLAILALLILAPEATRAQGLGLLDRFGPDGLPFTWDDPLAPGAAATELRFGAMGADTCSEEEGISPGNSAHGFSATGGHADRNDTHLQIEEWGQKLHDNHKARPQPNGFQTNPVLEAPFDMTHWILALNLEDAGVTRFRTIPEDNRWTNSEESYFSGRGWGYTPGWNGKESTANAAGKSMNDVWSGKAKNLHIEALGLGYRDLKPKGGFPIAIKAETLKLYPRFPKALEEAKVNLYTEQNYIEGWVLELTNLDNQMTGISGNFVADLAGLRILVDLNGFEQEQEVEGPFGIKVTCTAKIDNVTIEIGGPVNPEPTIPKSQAVAVNAKVPSQYVKDHILDPVIDAILPNLEIDGNLLCKAGNVLKDVFEPIIRAKMEEKIMEKMSKFDTIHALVGDDDYEVIGKYSGLAGRAGKNPFDKVALGTLEHLGQFKPHQWLEWKVVGDLPMAFDFDIGSITDIKTSSKVLTEQIQNAGGANWRYNNGGTYLMKSAMLFGNSAGEDDNPTPQTALAPAAQEKVPDILKSFAEQWTHLRMDLVDPYKDAEDAGVATWQSEDVLFPHDEAAKERFRLDWPPPNWNFGRAQLVGFRSGSGGEIQLQEPVTVRVESTLQSNWIYSIDPETMTYCRAGLYFRGGSANMLGTRGLAKKGDFGWTTPRPLPADLASQLSNGSGLRWLTVGVNHHVDGESELQFMWDFENDGELDSDHAQHFSDLGDSANFNGGKMAAVFTVQPRSSNGERGRTGFALVPADDAARQALGVSSLGN